MKEKAYLAKVPLNFKEKFEVFLNTNNINFEAYIGTTSIIYECPFIDPSIPAILDGCLNRLYEKPNLTIL